MMVSDYKPDAHLLHDTRLVNYTDSFNFFIGMRNEEVDFFDNRYMSVNIYERSQHGPIKSLLKFKKCTMDDLLQLIEKDMYGDYRNSICIDNIDDVNIMGSWYHSSYKSL